MECKHCLTDFHAENFDTPIHFADAPQHSANGSQYVTNYVAKTQVCSRCMKAHISVVESGQRLQTGTVASFPKGGHVPPPPSEVPAGLAADYSEANLVLPISAKASAALSRRCLQAVLASAGYANPNLAKQVQEAIDQTDVTKAFPVDIRDSMDAIRNFGNFSAHPISDLTTYQVIEVEAGEAEWCLELLAALFQHLYVRPQEAARKRAALNKKLAAAGKPEMKTRDPELADDAAPTTGTETLGDYGDSALITPATAA